MGNICFVDLVRERPLPILQIREEIVMGLTKRVLSLLNHVMNTKRTIDTQLSYIWYPSKKERKMHSKLWELKSWRNHGI